MAEPGFEPRLLQGVPMDLVSSIPGSSPGAKGGSVAQSKIRHSESWCSAVQNLREGTEEEAEAQGSRVNCTAPFQRLRSWRGWQDRRQLTQLALETRQEQSAG